MRIVKLVPYFSRPLFPGSCKFWPCAKALAVIRVGSASRSSRDDLEGGPVEKLTPSRLNDQLHYLLKLPLRALV